jgi:hypothetical protein
MRFRGWGMPTTSVKSALLSAHPEALSGAASSRSALDRRSARPAGFEAPGGAGFLPAFSVSFIFSIDFFYGNI